MSWEWTMSRPPKPEPPPVTVPRSRDWEKVLALFPPGRQFGYLGQTLCVVREDQYNHLDPEWRRSELRYMLVCHYLSDTGKIERTSFEHDDAPLLLAIHAAQEPQKGAK